MVTYDKLYLSPNLFGNPYLELIEFFSRQSKPRRLLDVGCGQGRNAIPLARMGYDITGLDNSEVGIQQMMAIAESESLVIEGIVTDIYEFQSYSKFDFILLDSMFHFYKKDLGKETELVNRVITDSKEGATIVFCLSNSGKTISTFERIISTLAFKKITLNADFNYTFKDPEDGTETSMPYKMIVLKK